jgi:hypothetical protein
MCAILGAPTLPGNNTIIKVLTILDINYKGINTSNNLSPEVMKKMAKKHTHKRGLNLSNDCGNMIVLEGTATDPMTIAIVKNGMSHPDYPTVCRSWTKSA